MVGGKYKSTAPRWTPGFDLSTVPDEALLAESARRLRARQKVPPHAKVLRQCPHCLRAFGAREMREHRPVCPRRGAKPEARPGWTLRKVVSAEEQDARSQRYWRSLLPGERIAATWELSEAAYSIRKAR